MNDSIKVHGLKIEIDYFNKILDGSKTFEIRKDDRGFRFGDVVNLNEFYNGEYTGRSIIANVGYVCDYAQVDGYVVFGLIEPKLD